MKKIKDGKEPDSEIKIVTPNKKRKAVIQILKEIVKPSLSKLNKIKDKGVININIIYIFFI